MRLMLAKLLPRSLSGRMTLILVLGLLAAQFASLLLHLQERAAMLADGHVHPGMPALDALPLRFIWHVSLTLAAVIIVSLVAVRWATKPLQQMASAATAFAHDLDAPALPLSGPTEVRRAAEAFNFMQHRLRQLVVERGRALAAVSHDLRTPLTRMRLRAELVDDPVLQDKLNADIDAMQGMVNSVLAYLRGLEDAEPIQPINMEALLSSIVEDEQALGRQVSLTDAAPGRAAAPYAGKLSDRIEPRLIASTGMFLNAVGLFFLAFIGQDTPQWIIILLLLFMGFGFALFSSPNMNTIMSSVEKRQLGTASGTASTMRIVGQMISMTLVMLLFSARFNGTQIAQIPNDLFVGTVQYLYLLFGILSLAGVYFSMARGDLRK